MQTGTFGIPFGSLVDSVQLLGFIGTKESLEGCVYLFTK